MRPGGDAVGISRRFATDGRCKAADADREIHADLLNDWIDFREENSRKKNQQQPHRRATRWRSETLSTARNVIRLTIRFLLQNYHRFRSKSSPILRPAGSALSNLGRICRRKHLNQKKSSKTLSQDSAGFGPVQNCDSVPAGDTLKSCRRSTRRLVVVRDPSRRQAGNPVLVVELTLIPVRRSSKRKCRRNFPDRVIALGRHLRTSIPLSQSKSLARP